MAFNLQGMIDARVDRIVKQQDPTYVAGEKMIVAELDSIVEAQIDRINAQLKRKNLTEPARKYYQSRLDYYMSS